MGGTALPRQLHQNAFCVVARAARAAFDDPIAEHGVRNRDVRHDIRRRGAAAHRRVRSRSGRVAGVDSIRVARSASGAKAGAKHGADMAGSEHFHHDGVGRFPNQSNPRKRQIARAITNEQTEQPYRV